MAPPRHTNRLADSTSPYLLQHAHNPVDWSPWGEEALARARAEDKPILLSIGYSACHWCHVMERESFENEAIAALMNDHFVPIKVDREERPDLDDIYMAATLAMNQGHGGWPMTVFLTPDQEPFFAGTYFPPEDKYGRPGFRTLLERIADLWRRDRAGLREQGAELARYLRENARAAPGTSVGAEALKAALAQYEADFDARWGGFGRAPKFPPSVGLMLLLRCHRRFGSTEALAMVEKTLDAMARGGMYDQVGGGFARYSVDERWLVPHFEKMLYDNALLARAYLEGFQVTADPFHQRIAAETLDYVLREMTSAEGGFYSATDADSEGEEGKFFVWTPEEIRAAVGDDEDARRFCAYYDVEEGGNFEGKSIPNTPRSLPEVAARLGVPPADLEASLAPARALVYKARLLRVAPGLDDKILTAWNGLMIGALAEGHRVLGDPRYLEAGRRAADFLLERLRAPDGRLRRTYRAGVAHLAAYLEDYAYLADALVDLHEAGAPARYLREAEALAERMRADFADGESGGFFSTARDHERLIVRHREGHDGATPAANAVAARVLARLSYHLDRADLREDAVKAIRAYGRAIERQPRAFPMSLIAVDLLLDGPTELAFVGRPADPALGALRGEVARHYLPSRIVGHLDPGAPEDLPLLAGKTPVDGKAALYVCRDFACLRPVTDPGDVATALSAAIPAGGGRSAALAPKALPGRATPEGTARYAARRPAAAAGYGPLGTTGLVAGRIGFGGYRIDDDTAGHREALVGALRSGINLIDTSTNYTDGGSERLVGSVLAELDRRGDVRRDEVVVVSKAGYVQGRNLERAQARAAAGTPFPDMVEYADGVWHCIHPEFLRDQLTRSLERLQLETLDLLLLHNPEYYLSDAHERSHGTLEKRREEFDRRIADAFAHLEEEVRAGRIGAYGVSSNTCVRPASDPEFTSLTRLLARARAAGGEGHHFRVLQLPLNLMEPGAALERNNGPDHSRTVLEQAAAEHVAVLANRPLNAMTGDSLLRLAMPEVPEEAPSLDDALAEVASAEAEYRREIAAHLEGAEGSVPPEQFFRWGDDLRGVAGHVNGLEHWDALEQQRILPRLTQALEVLDRTLSGPLVETWRAWRAGYVPLLRGALLAMRARAAAKSRDRARGIERALDPLLPPERRGESLARKALWVVASLPGVSCVLLGARAPAYVADAAAVLAWPPLEKAASALAAVAPKPD
jgi:uncharacterized protein YyaL (SSP411 family)/aryl-alcohol dehydrogenase-like predicted oxidoreductase